MNGVKNTQAATVSLSRVGYHQDIWKEPYICALIATELVTTLM